MLALMTLLHKHLMCPLPSSSTECLGKLADDNGSCSHSNGFLLAMMAVTYSVASHPERPFSEAANYQFCNLQALSAAAAVMSLHCRNLEHNVGRYTTARRYSAPLQHQLPTNLDTKGLHSLHKTACHAWLHWLSK